MNIDTSLYPDRPAPSRLDTPDEKADYLQRVCGAFDHGLPPTADTLKELRHWKDVFDRFALPGSPAYHTLRSFYGWEDAPRLPYLTPPPIRCSTRLRDVQMAVNISCNGCKRRMDVAIQLPDDIAKHLGDTANMPRQVLEALAAEAYRARKLSRHQVSKLLGLDYWQTEQFLTEHEAKRPYTLADLEIDRQSLARLPQR